MSVRLLISIAGLLLLWLSANWLRSPRMRQGILLLAGYIFYGVWDARFLGLLILSSLLNYRLGAYLKRRVSAGRLWLGLGFNLALLGAFKILPLAKLIPGANWLHTIALPLGISFWTFQAMSYLLDLYREEDLDPSLLEFCVYMAFFPTVVAGPIARLGNMLPQFREPGRFLWVQFGAGMRRVLLGIFMIAAGRVLGSGLAPNLGVDGGFARSWQTWSALDVWVLCIGYGFQLFFDFAGYSNLVIGIAQTLGFELPENFNSPYLSQSPSQFWTRWHMSLSFWIRDYVFLPLAMLRRGTYWKNIALFTSMLAFGLWHKVSFTFLLWGAYHGLLLVAHRLWQQWSGAMGKTLSRWGALVPWLVTFLSVNLGWILFRARDLAQAKTMFWAVMSPRAYAGSRLPHVYYVMVGWCVVGYFLIMAGNACLTWLSRRLPASGGLPQRWLGVIANERWVWVGPLMAVLALYVFAVLNVPTSASAPTMYRVF
jgi:alginate O-acetyltransferase complex protein AlgI